MLQIQLPQNDSSIYKPLNNRNITDKGTNYITWDNKKFELSLESLHDFVLNIKNKSQIS